MLTGGRRRLVFEMLWSMYDDREVWIVDPALVLSALADDLFLSEVNLAGTHDSATAFVVFSRLARCQNLTIPQQLELGVRLLDIRLFRRGKQFYLVHAKADCFADAQKREKLCFQNVLDACKSFLQAHPRETIVMSVKQDRGHFETAFFETFYEMFIRPQADLWFTDNRVPQLSECRGKIVLMRRCKRAENFESAERCGLDFSVWADQASKSETAPLPVILSPFCDALVQDRYRLAPEAKWKMSAEPFIASCRPTKTHICIHFLSTCGGKGVPEENAEQVNSWFSVYAFPTDRPRGWFFMDFPTEALCAKIMQSNLALRTNAERGAT